MTEFDLLIKGGRIVSGAGNPWFRADVGISDGRIRYIGRESHEDARKEISARGLIIAPGFIDTHSHYMFQVLKDPACEPLVRQGITTALFGQDGFSAFPIHRADENLLKYLVGLEGEIPPGLEWRSFREYFAIISSSRTAINLATLVGHGSVREAVKGFSHSKADQRELEAMAELVRAAMKDGAFGISTGLVYPPGMFGSTEEIIELSKAAREFGGIYVSHIRGEGKNLIAAVTEAIRIGKEAKLPVHISHHKALGQANWGKIRETIKILEESRKSGLEVTADQYPYTAGSTMFTALVPPWLLEGGPSKMLRRLSDPKLRLRAKRDCENGLPDWETYADIPKNIVVSYCKVTKSIEGKTVEELSKTRGRDPTMTLFDILTENDGMASCIVFHQDEKNIRRIMQTSFTNFCTDGLATGKPHPRLYGTFPRVLGRYVRERNVLPLEEAVRKMTSLPAQRLGLQNRGIIAPGMVADIVIFNSTTVLDKSTYDNPTQFPDGIEHVIVSGKLVVENSNLTRERPGSVLLRSDESGKRPHTTALLSN